ncbi:restriction endonuclease subunit M [Nocardioides sp. Root140]|uniref:restriction endonuclease subunit M n=1 Tax=Nocardioides sp. Root140 TaxID=1736460 RepID=UPI0006FD4AFE|nr:restriction endonuclease subunit M [Nocardioides sp. Root140]KQY51563.1 restriction endonuclease subunit M [Nocardioides sp. Root140]
MSAAGTTQASQASDAIVVGEGWISEHYFTTDATKESFNALVRDRRKQWEEIKDEGTPRTRFTAHRSVLLDAFSTIDAADTTALHELHQSLLHVLGYKRLGLVAKTEGPLTMIYSAGIDAPGLAIIEARPTDGPEDLLTKDSANLLSPFAIDDKTEITSVARLLSRLFVDDDYKPPFALVLAGPHVLIAERERWPEGRYLSLDLQLVGERNDAKVGGEVDRALTCLAADSLAPDAEGNTWWTHALAASVQHTVGVSKDLREGVRLSIEIIANEVVRRRRERDLEALPHEDAQPLAKQSLRFLYRILFLLYAEASPELGVLPSGAREYDTGYSIDRLRELTLVQLPTNKSRSGTHLYESLAALFRLVDQGHQPPSENESGFVEGLTFRSLRADLFKPEATGFIDEVGLGNGALQRVLQHLLLSKADKTRKGRDRGFISYAELGINQLGAVYEGLMSYTGRFAETDLYEVCKDGDAEKGSWLVPVARAEGIAAKDFVTTEDEITGEIKPVIHDEGNFVFRLAGRERQQSASYYTPEVLTRFTVSQALGELLDQDGRTTTAEEILALTICEPALGSGAFAIEAVRQLAEHYLVRRQAELGETIDPDEYPRQLQRVKAYLALHQTYGVDLNATAVELAEISLWLDTMVEGLEAPWFGLHLRRGNSLVGARRSVFTRKQVDDKTWLDAAPKRLSDESLSGRVHHFLLPAAGWGAAADVGKEVKDLVPDAVTRLKDWRKTTKAKPTKKQVDQFVDLSERVERLWEIATRRLEIAEQQVRRDIPLWGRDLEPIDEVYVSRESIEESLADSDGAYQRLRRIMDAWCALWFWPLTESEIAPPTTAQWHDALSMILGSNTTMSKVQAKKGDDTFADVQTWDELGDAEHNDRVFAGARSMGDVLEKHTWLGVCERVALQQGFFHWELDFATVFVGREGFDLQTGNPPWVRPTVDEQALLAEGDPWWQLAVKPTQKEVGLRREATLEISGLMDLLLAGTVDTVAMATFVGSRQLFPELGGLQPDLYRCFVASSWRHQSRRGAIGFIHPETHFTDERAGAFRAPVYRHLRRHWQFENTLGLFDIGPTRSYGVHVYGRAREHVDFLSAVGLLHPDTASRSLVHDGSGPEPAMRTEDGEWDLRPHSSRVFKIGLSQLAGWHALLETDDVPVPHTRMVYAINRSVAGVLDKLSGAERIGALGLQYSGGWHEKGDRAKGRFDVRWGAVASWDDAILQGPHLYVNNPAFKSPNPTMLHKQDWSSIDLEDLSPDAFPVTSYKPMGTPAAYGRAYTNWESEGEALPARAFYRVAWRNMAANIGERTLIPAIIPPGATHIHGISSAGAPHDERTLVVVAGFMASLVGDFAVRAAPKSTISGTTVDRLPVNLGSGASELLSRILRLNCVTAAYGDLWARLVHEMRGGSGWAGGIDYPGRPLLDQVAPTWTSSMPLRRASDRRQAALEVDALCALLLGLTADELCVIYRTEFTVLSNYDRKTNYFDANGRLVPTPVLQVFKSKGGAIGLDERTHTNASGNTYVYELPFVTLDREADMRTAYAHFETVLGGRSDG